jgi:preprotein translocase subunit YajC
MNKILRNTGLFMTLASTQLLFGQEEPVAPIGGRDDFMQTFMMIGIALLFFYFIIFRPEQKRRKEMDAKREALRKGDKVTAVGIIGTIKEIKKDTIILKMVDGQSCIEVLKHSVTEVVGEETKDNQAAKK